MSNLVISDSKDCLDAGEEIQRALNFIKENMLAKKWSYNDLAAAAGMPTQTVKNWYGARQSEPSPRMLLLVCEALGVAMSELWAKNDMVELTGERKEFFEEYQKLTKSRKEAVMHVMKEFNKYEK